MLVLQSQYIGHFLSFARISSFGTKCKKPNKLIFIGYISQLGLRGHKGPGNVINAALAHRLSSEPQQQTFDSRRSTNVPTHAFE